MSWVFLATSQSLQNSTHFLVSTPHSLEMLLHETHVWYQTCWLGIINQWPSGPVSTVHHLLSLQKFLNWQLTGESTWRKLCEFWACSVSWSGWWFYISVSISGLPWWLRGKQPPCQCRRCGFDPWVRKIPWRRMWQPTPVFLPGNPMDRRAWRTMVHGLAEVSDTT